MFKYRELNVDLRIKTNRPEMNNSIFTPRNIDSTSMDFFGDYPITNFNNNMDDLQDDQIFLIKQSDLNLEGLQKLPSIPLGIFNA